MKLRKTVFVVAVALAGLFLATTTNAQLATTNDKTILTFDKPVEVPGMILPAGTYTFQLMDSPSTDRHIVQVFDKSGPKLITTILAVPETLQSPADETIIRFNEVKAGEPQALRAWFYPSRTTGNAFVYPKARAMELAAVSNQPVPSTESSLDMLNNPKPDVSGVVIVPATTEPQTTTPVQSQSTTPVQVQTQTQTQTQTKTPPNPTTTPIQTTPVQTTPVQTTPVQTTPVQTTPAQTPPASVAPASPPPTEPAAEPTDHKRRELPHTASSAPLSMLVGLMAMGLGAGLARIGRKQNI